MPQKCRVCQHNDTKKMEEEYVAGKPKTRIATRYGVNVRSVDYHMAHHLPQKLVRSVQANEADHAEDILGGIKDLLSRTKKILMKAERKGQKRLALDAIKEARGTYELLAKIAAKLHEFKNIKTEKEDNSAERQVQKGLEALSDTELKTYMQLQAKIHASSVGYDYELPKEVRMFVDSVGRMQSYDAVSDGASSPPVDEQDEHEPKGETDLEVPRNAPHQPENRREHESNDLDLELDDFDDWDDEDWDDFDEFDEPDDTIPSEETDPDWLVEERNRRR